MVMHRAAHHSLSSATSTATSLSQLAASCCALQVAYSMACCAAAAAEWEESGREGLQPAYCLLPLPQPAAARKGMSQLMEQTTQSAAATLLGGNAPAPAGIQKTTANGPALLQQQTVPEVQLPHRAAQLSAGQQQQQQQQKKRRTHGTANLSSVYAAALPTPAHLPSMRSCLPLDSSNSSSCGSLAVDSQLPQSPTLRRSGTAGNAPAAACFACCTGVAKGE